MRLCFTTVVYGWYQDFIPLYIQSVLTAFPQHFVKIFLLDSLTENNKQSIQVLKSKVSDRFEVVDNFHELDSCEVPHLASLRFLLTREYFEGFDYVYFGDVDILVFNEYNDNFYDSYATHCKRTGLPFSNAYNYYENKYRATGLHFIIKEPYFDAMDRIINEMRTPRPLGGWWNNTFRSQCFHNPLDPSYDEELLYHMLSQTFDLRLLKNYCRTNHGWHLGEYRYYYLNEYKSPFHYKLRGMLLADKSYQRVVEKQHLKKIFSLVNSENFHEIYKNLGEKTKTIVDLGIQSLNRKLFL